MVPAELPRIPEKMTMTGEKEGKQAVNDQTSTQEGQQIPYVLNTIKNRIKLCLQYT